MEPPVVEMGNKVCTPAAHCHPRPPTACAAQRRPAPPSASQRCSMPPGHLTQAPNPKQRGVQDEMLLDGQIQHAAAACGTTLAGHARPVNHEPMASLVAEWAKVKPRAPAAGQKVPYVVSQVRRTTPILSLLSSSWGSRISSLNTQGTPHFFDERGSPAGYPSYLVRNVLRTRLSSPSLCARAMSASRKRVGSMRLPNPPETTIGIPRRRQQSIRRHFSATSSIASTTTSKGCLSRISSAVLSSNQEFTAVTLQSGLICATRSAMTSTLGRPTVPIKACSWRLVLLMQTSSKSTKVRPPKPVRARPSTTQEPTPPRPTTAQRAERRRGIASAPKMSFTPRKRKAYQSVASSSTL
mmetsp:Transcript_34848/g.80837  ORF Transcript_34848/g.80837 Transcript_34848/m.80837 type:complete len:354 (-) Transcript_34848:86-1147(-)